MTVTAKAIIKSRSRPENGCGMEESGTVVNRTITKTTSLEKGSTYGLSADQTGTRLALSSGTRLAPIEDVCVPSTTLVSHVGHVVCTNPQPNICNPGCSAGSNAGA